jgi:hypothetical protein
LPKSRFFIIIAEGIISRTLPLSHSLKAFAALDLNLIGHRPITTVEPTRLVVSGAGGRYRNGETTANHK